MEGSDQFPTQVTFSLAAGAANEMALTQPEVDKSVSSVYPVKFENYLTGAISARDKFVFTCPGIVSTTPDSFTPLNSALPIYSTGVVLFSKLRVKGTSMKL